MANVKFSDFAVRTTVPTVDYIVGYQGADNIQIAPTDFLGDYLPLAGGTMIGNTLHGDLVYSYWGASNDLRIYHNGADSHIDNYAGNLNIVNNTNGGDINLYCDDGGGGVTTYMTIDGGAEQITVYKDAEFQTSVRAYFGSSGNMQFSHDGNNGTWQNDTGHMYIRNTADDKDIILLTDVGGSHTEYIKLDGANEEIYFYQNTVHLDNVKSYWGNAGDLEIYHDTSNSYIVDTGTGSLKVCAANWHLMNSAATEYMATGTPDGPIILYYDNSQKFSTTASGIEVDATAAVATNPSYIVANETAGIFKMAIGVQNSPGVAQECFVGTLGNTDFKFKANSVDVGRVTTSAKLLIGAGGGVPTAALQVLGIVEYADNAAALAAGLTAGAFYRTGDLLKVVH